MMSTLSHNHFLIFFGQKLLSWSNLSKFLEFCFLINGFTSTFQNIFLMVPSFDLANTFSKGCLIVISLISSIWLLGLCFKYLEIFFVVPLKVKLLNQFIVLKLLYYPFSTLWSKQKRMAFYQYFNII